MSESNQNRQGLLILIALIVLALVAVLLLFVVILSDSGESDDDNEVANQPTVMVNATQDPAQNPDTSNGEDTRPTPTSSDDPDGSVDASIGGTPDTAATFEYEVEAVVNPTATVPPVIIPSSTPIDADDIPVPQARTLVAQPGVEPLQPGGVFEFIRYVQDSTNEDLQSVTEIYPDGRVVRDEFEGQVAMEDVQRINDMITELNFFGMQGNLISNTRTEDETLYRLTIMRSGIERAVFAQDGFMPAQLIELMAAIRSLGDQVAMEAMGF